MSLPGDDGFKQFQEEIKPVVKKFFDLDSYGEERKLFCTLTALEAKQSWRDRLRNWFFQAIFRCRYTDEKGRELWERRLFDWERHLDAYFQIADKKKKGGSYAGTGPTGTESTATISSYSVGKHGTERIGWLFEHLQVLDAKFSMLLAVNSVVVALVGLSLNETTDLFGRMRSLGLFGASWFQGLILAILSFTIMISFFNIWYAIRGFRRVVWGNLGCTDSANGEFDAAKREREYAHILILSLARRTNIFRIVAHWTRWAIGLFMTFAVLAGVMFVIVFVRSTHQSDPSSAKCIAAPQCCCAGPKQPDSGAVSGPGTSPAIASVTIGNLGLAGDQAKNAIPQESTLHLSAKLEDALTGYLIKGGSPAGDSLFSGGRGLALFLLLAAGAGLLAWAVRKRPAVAAPLGAVGLAAAVIKNPEHLSRLSWGGFLFVLIIFSLVSLVLLILSFIEFLHRLSPRDEEGEEGDGKHRTESKAVESPLNIVFSLAVLIWAVMIACYHAEPAIGPVQPPTATRLIPSASVLESPLSGFPRREDDPTKIPSSRADLRTWKTNMSNAVAKPGDLLLLLGSADCTAIQKSKDMTNKDLARKRAENVRQMLIDAGPLTDKDVQAESLYQHQNCRESEDMRAVFPVLIHMEQEKPK
jgi:uncharacterized membrane protein